jgi:hypothetical protein
VGSLIERHDSYGIWHVGGESRWVGGVVDSKRVYLADPLGNHPVDFSGMALGAKIGGRPSDVATILTLLKPEFMLPTPLPKGGVIAIEFR